MFLWFVDALRACCNSFCCWILKKAKKWGEKSSKSISIQTLIDIFVKKRVKTSARKSKQKNIIFCSKNKKKYWKRSQGVYRNRYQNDRVERSETSRYYSRRHCDVVLKSKTANKTTTIANIQATNVQKKTHSTIPQRAKRTTKNIIFVKKNKTSQWLTQSVCASASLCICLFLCACVNVIKVSGLTVCTIIVLFVVHTTAE